MLATKLYIPPPRPNSVPRPHLLARLNEGLHRKLTLISAPAGFGKTTLVTDWLAGRKRPVAWLSLDEGDNDLPRFLAYLIGALQTIAAHLGEGTLRALQSPQPLPTEMMLTTLLNDLATTISDQFVLVLDDYHVIGAKPVDLALAFLLERLPTQMRLVIATREDPQLPVARLRAQGQLTELRAADLRFTPAEASAFLTSRMGLSLSPEDIATLERRTEGWIAGLQLAALSLQGRQDASGFIRAFAGDHRYIADYLVDEVLERQPEPIRRFLLQTAILDRLHGPLCDAVTGQERGAARLEALERGNFFIVPLDDTRHWYRYHHLFADVLSAHLLAEQPEQVASLHQRASVWYEQHGAAPDAIRHALVARDFVRAADLIELAVPELRQRRLGTTVGGWLKALPDELIRFRPVLSVAYAWALLASGELKGMEARLQDAERWLDTTADRSEMVVVGDEDFRRLPAAIAMYRAAHAQIRGDVADTLTYARRALDLAQEDDQLVRGAAAALLGLASWASGDLDTARQTYAEGMAHVQRAGYISDVINGTITLADISIAQGHLREAMRAYERSLRLATEQGEPALQGTADLHVGMSELCRERNDLDVAMQHLLRSTELGERAGIPPNRSRWRVAMARLREAQGDLVGALDLLHEAERLYVSDFFPNVRPIAALRTRLWVAQGRLGDAFDWARERGLSAQDDLSYLREFEHITLAKALLARYQRDHVDGSLREAVELLERLLHAAEDNGRTGSVLDILAQQALAHQTRGDIPTALVPLRRALTLAEPEGYVRLFVDEGPPMATLLAAAAKHEIAPDYVGQLLSAFSQADGKAKDSRAATQGLIEPLSERELEVLRLLGTHLDGPEIARELVVSLNTMRTHTKNIYSKLGVNSRRAAVRRAEELALF